MVNKTDATPPLGRSKRRGLEKGGGYQQLAVTWKSDCKLNAMMAKTVHILELLRAF